MRGLSESLRRLRLVLPSDGKLVAFVVVFVLLEVPFRLAERFLNWQGLPHPARFLMMVGSIAIGFGRASAFHPSFHVGYHDWLLRTPWRRGRTLPGGPVFPVPEDLLVVGALVLLATTQPNLPPESIATRYLAGYAFGLMLPMWSAGAGTHGYLTLFLLGLVARFWSEPKAALAASAVATLAALTGLWRTLGALSERTHAKMPTAPKVDGSESDLEIACGWPYDQLSPKLGKTKPTPLADRLLVSILLGWLSFCVCGFFSEGDRDLLIGFALGIACLIFIPGRVMLYRSWGAPPISFWGRVATMRFVIPGYDWIYLAPSLTLVAVVACLYEFKQFRLDPEISYALTISIASAISLTTGPTAVAWRLTGKSRTVPKTSPKTGEFVTPS